MKILKKIITLLVITFALQSEATVRLIQLHGGYHTFYYSLPFELISGKVTMKVYLGDTIRWYNGYPTYETVGGENFHSITYYNGPIGAPFYDFTWDNSIYNLTFDYIPTVTGAYHFVCLPHSSVNGNGMAGYFLVTERPNSVCGNGAIKGSTCTGVGLCVTCTGNVINCVCTTTSNITSTVCSNGFVENNTCAGTLNCTSCAGIVINCLCTNTTPVLKPEITIESPETYVFPNPANDFINISLRKTLKYNISILNNKGEEVIYKRVELVDKIEIDISNLPKGNYYINAKYCPCSTII